MRSSSALVVVLLSAVLFLLARALRWHEGITFDDAFSLLLGVLPFGFFLLVSRLKSVGEASVGLFSVAWLLTLAAFLIVHLNYSLRAYESLIYGAIGRNEWSRLAGSFAYVCFGVGA